MRVQEKICPVCGLDVQGQTERCPRDNALLSGSDPLLGTVLDDKYEILAFAGMGGMSEVYRAQHLELGRLLALKFLKSSQHLDLQRFRREAISISQLEHRNIAKVYAFAVSADGRPYIVLEYLDGQDLATILQNERPLSLGRAMDLIDQIACGLEHAHARGVIHRDIKPGNIIVVDEAGESTAKIVDFGTARLVNIVDQKLTVAGEVFGTTEYISPERFAGAEGDARADIYSLGMLAYECIVFDGRVPEMAQPFLKRAMEADPEKRYQSVSQLREGIALMSDGMAFDHRYVPFESSWVKPSGPNWQLMSVMVGLLFLGMVAVIACKQIILQRAQMEMRSGAIAGSRPPLGRAALVEKVDSLIKSGKYEDGKRLCLQWLERARNDNQIGDEDMAEVGTCLARCCQAMGDGSAAENWWLQTIASYGAKPGTARNMSRLGLSRGLLAQLYINQNRAADARKIALENLSERDAMPAAVVVDSLKFLSDAARQDGNLDDAKRYAREALGVAVNSFGDNDDELALARFKMGLVLVARHEYKEAEPLIREFIREESFRRGEVSGPCIDGKLALAEALIGQKREVEAETLLTALNETCEQLIVPNRLKRVILNKLATICKLEGKKKEAQAYEERARELPSTP